MSEHFQGKFEAELKYHLNDLKILLMHYNWLEQLYLYRKMMKQIGI
ncbi:hypothetical protein [Proteus mirabilis]